MKKNKIIFGILCCMMALMSCTANRVVQYQSESASTSSIKVKPSTRLRNVVVTLDGNLVWEKTRTVKSLTIENSCMFIVDYSLIVYKLFKENENLKGSVHTNFIRKGSFIWRTVSFCLIWSAFVLYCLTWLDKIRPGT